MTLTTIATLAVTTVTTDRSPPRKSSSAGCVVNLTRVEEAAFE
jgi:hypothetical protein